MELKNIISETLNEIEKMAKTIDNNFDAVQKTPSFFKTPPHLQNTPNPQNTPLGPKNAAKIETQEKITEENTEENTEEKEEETKEIIIEEITPQTPTQVLISSERVFLKNLLERTLVLFKGMQALEEKEAMKRLNLVVRFLQYQLSALEKRLESLEKENTE
ncbi:CiaD-like domain-containing protein [Helicobacter pylori]|uniref:CiaD-like domain-containing protein n=1 Tax=Helicobacter pylori TaxID=210 RepID=UPI003465AD6F